MEVDNGNVIFDYRKGSPTFGYKGTYYEEDVPVEENSYYDDDDDDDDDDDYY